MCPRLDRTRARAFKSHLKAQARPVTPRPVRLSVLSSPGGINSLSVKLANIHGTPLPVSAQVSNPPAALPEASDSSPKRTETSGTTTPAAGSGIAVVPLLVPAVIIAGQTDAPDQGKEQKETSRAEEHDAHPAAPTSAENPAALPLTAAGGDADAAVAKNATPSEAKGAKQIYSQKSILEQFQEYRGARTAAAFIAIFRQESMIGVQQYPSIAISDGESPVKVRFVSSPGERTASDVAIMGARLISLKRDPDNTNTWIAQLVPEKGACRASLGISQGNLKMIYPLIVAPKADVHRARTGSVSESDFTLYLNSRRTAGSSPADLNRDGRQDYVDDYIFTANYLEAVETAQRRAKEGMTGMAGH